jgi:hypothetical protein
MPSSAAAVNAIVGDSGRQAVVAGSLLFPRLKTTTWPGGAPAWGFIAFEPLAKLPIDNHCHSERSEESRIFRGLRSFTPFRMTEKRLLQEARLPKVFSDRRVLIIPPTPL